jgi:hypothetical protein
MTAMICAPLSQVRYANHKSLEPLVNRVFAKLRSFAKNYRPHFVGSNQSLARCRFSAYHSASVGTFALGLAVCSFSRQGSGGRPACRHACQKAVWRADVAAPIRRRPSFVCWPLPSAPPCILHLERGPSGPTTTLALHRPPARVLALHRGAQ